MARIKKTGNLQTREARARLDAGREHWFTIEPGRALGYRKGKRGGKWIAREQIDGEYKYRRLGTADDNSDADGATVLSFAQAQRVLLTDDRPSRRAAGYTVADAMADYIDTLEREGRGGTDTCRRANTIAGTLGKHDLGKLTKRQIRDWFDAIVNTPPRNRAGKPRKGVDMQDPEVQRKRRACANRELTILKAALNLAHREGLIESDAAWRTIKPFRGTDGARTRYLSLAEIRRLLNACPPDLRALVNGALSTGARVGDLRAMRVGDFDADAGAVFVGNRKARYAGKRAMPAYLSDEGFEFFATHTAGRNPDDPMFVRADGDAWTDKTDRRPLQDASKAARINPPVTPHVLRHTYASHAVMAGVPLMVVAQNLGHSDTRMVEKHYAHLAPSYARDAIRAGLPAWGIASDSNVKPIDRGRA